MTALSSDFPTETGLRISDLPFPQPVSDHQRIANTLWLIENNPDGRALLPAALGEEDAPRFAAVLPSPGNQSITGGILARMAEGDAASADAGPQSAETAPQIGQFLLAQNSGASPSPTKPPPVTEAQKANFFNQHYDLANKVAARYGIDPARMLGLSALESTWGTHHFATDLNNPFGWTPDGATPTTFSSFDDAWDEWGKAHGPRVMGLGSNIDEFLDRLHL